MFSGNGVLETPMGVYEGDFENNMRSGKGIMKYTDGSTYDGLWKDDKFHGKGTHTTSVGTYVGDFVKGQREGEGTFTFGNIFYDGSWKEGKFNGFGLFRSTNSYETQFEGEWEQGKKYKGIQSFADGSKWDGSFTNGKMSGVGKMTYPNGLVIEGKWKNGIRDGKMVTATRDNVKIAVEKGREESSNAEYLPPESFPFVDTQQWMSGL
uniref:MORN repeat-containing protein 5 n=1 Tax=Arcella intermedia TaxID=1963864 RepID=A0A6B2LEX9_9EUKA